MGDHAQDDAHPGVGRAVTVAGAILSLAFMTGLGVWGYKLMMRDVSGVPVVRAIEGPMRVQPEDPGGRPADHQGLAVNAVAAVGEAAPTPDRLVLAPRPVSLTEEDMPLTALAQAEEERIQQASAEGPVEEDALADDESRPEELDEDAIAALVEELTQGVDPLGEVGDDLAALAPDVDWPEEPLEDEEGYIPEEDEESIEIPAEVIVAPGVSRSPRPLPRPAALTRPSTTPQTAAPAQPAPVAEVDADKVAPGTRLAQLGAFESEEVARSEWVKLAGRFGDYLDGKSRVVQKAASGGRTFYRLRAMGFEDLADARRFCSALVAEGADCIPVVTR
ncbi:hypothetical protein ATO3_03915 [Marinibacterium profundimaris]|uniref:SPOR domain-containing protein n=1 Tax=Marinibacterium profundimaris TaxID=1679460 RepID=A0A225NT30_9RHOB|nr:hypothetical protein ATO3_03915 [Marinibacterium profundimaris]